jgi:3-oxoacyl-[acyl-carrier-protein] synthase-3
MGIVIAGTGSYLPEKLLTNDQLYEQVTDFDVERAGRTLDDWVLDKVGIASRHRVAPGEGTSAMAVHAANRALDAAGLDAADLDLLILSTFTSDHRLPQSVSLVQAELGTTAKSLQIETACCGFLDGTIVAKSLMETIGYQTALVVHSESCSAVMDHTEFMVGAIFGDGAGAVVLRNEPASTAGILSGVTSTDGTKASWLRAGGGTLSPITAETLQTGEHLFKFDYKKIFADAVERLVESSMEVLAKAGDSLDDVDWVIAHQANIRIIQAVADQVGMDHGKFLVNIDRVGNTSGATIPIALDEFTRDGTIKTGDRILLPAVGAGLNWGALYLEWDPVPGGSSVDLRGASSEGARSA